jgi:hypothetical protein
MNLFPVKLLEVAVTGCPDFVTQTTQLVIFTSVGPTTTHSARFNSHHRKQVAYVGELRLENAFCRQKHNYGTLLKSHRGMFSPRFHFMQNGKKKKICWTQRLASN